MRNAYALALAESREDVDTWITAAVAAGAVEGGVQEAQEVVSRNPSLNRRQRKGSVFDLANVRDQDEPLTCASCSHGNRCLSLRLRSFHPSCNSAFRRAQYLTVRISRTDPSVSWGVTLSVHNRVTELVDGGAAQRAGIRLWDRGLCTRGVCKARSDR